MRQAIAFAALAVAGLGLSGGAVAADPPPTPRFTVGKALPHPAGEQTTQGGYGRPILTHWLTADEWVALEKPLKVPGIRNGNLTVGQVLTRYTDYKGQAVYCVVPLIAGRADGAPVQFLTSGSSSAGLMICLTNKDGDRTFDGYVIASQLVNFPPWDIQSFPASRPLPESGAFRAGTAAERPTSQLRAALLTLPFLKGYFLSLQVLLLGANDRNDAQHNVVPATPNGPAAAQIGPLRVDIRSHAGGVFTYTILSDLEGAPYPSLGRTPAP